MVYHLTINNLFEELYFERGWDHLMHVVQKQGLMALCMIVVFMRERSYLVHSMTPKAVMLCMVAAWMIRLPSLCDLLLLALNAEC